MLIENYNDRILMNKDTVIASIIGLVLGLIAAVALWVVPRFMSKNTNPIEPQASITNETQASPKNENLSLEITSPKNGEIAKSSAVKISGKTIPESIVILNTPAVNQSAISDKDGNFSINLNLDEGSNPVAVTSFKNGETITKNISLYYFSEE